MTLFEIICILLAAPFLSAACSVGFYTAAQFDGDEEYDIQSRKRKRDWPTPGPHQVMILWWVRFYLGRIIPHKWTKPIYSCLPCMGSLHSVYPVVLVMYLAGLGAAQFFVIWPVVALATVGINKLITVWWR